MLLRTRARKPSSWGFVPQSNLSNGSKLAPGRRQVSPFCSILEGDYKGQMDFKYCTGRITPSVFKKSARKRRESYKGCKYSSQYVYIRRNSKLIRKKCNRTCTSRPGRSRVLQHFLHCSKEGRRSASDIKSQKVKFISECSSLQNGNSQIDNLCSGTKRLGSIHGLEGRIPACSSSTTVQTVSPILFSRSSLSVQGNAIWSSSSAQNFHEANVSCRQPSQIPTNSGLHVSGRLAHKTSKFRTPDIPKEGSLDNYRKLRPDCKLLQISTGTQTDNSISGISIQPTEGYHLPFSREMCEVNRGNQIHHCPVTSTCTEVLATSRTHDVLYRPYTMGPFTYAPYPILCPVFLETSQGQPSSTDTSQGTPSSTPQLVAQSEQSLERSPASSPSVSDPMDRCVQDRVGSSHGNVSDLGHLECTGEIRTHQLARNESSTTCSSSFSTVDNREKGSSEMRQFNGCSVYQQARGDQISTSMSSDVGNSTVGTLGQYSNSSSTHSRKAQYSCGRPFKRKYDKNNRVESGPQHCENDISEVHSTKHRFICDKGEQETSSLLFPLSRPRGMGDRCPECRLEGDLCICISTPNTDTSDPKENTNGTVRSDSNRTTSNKAVLVSKSSLSSSRLSKKITSDSKNAHSKKRTNSSQKSRKSQSGSLESIQQSRTSSGLSQKAKGYIKQARRLSTRRLYDARLSIYKNWCDQQSINPSFATVEDLTTFFIYLHEIRNCKATTISGYRSAIASIHEGLPGGGCISQDKTLSNLIKGIFNSSPNIRPLIPNWDLPAVLRSLVQSPFEPLATCDMKFLTWKTVFLLALATASQVSELHALSVNAENLRLENTGIRLLPNLQFLAKTQRIGKAWKPYFIPKFDTFATDSEDILLCPCRALKIYLERTKGLRSQILNLFITYQKGNHKAAAKSSISRWIVSLIRYVYENLPQTLTSVRAHDTRRLSSSWALFNGATIQEILQAAHWASETTFTSFYLKDVSWNEDLFARASLLETANWARRKSRCQERRH